MIQVDLITGFLGSGKTTFIIEYASYLVRQGKKVAIIVNDYGAINVDRLLLQEKLGDSCQLEMVIGGDADCSRRRLKTKLITMAMEKYEQVLVEPSGIFDVDDFFDMLYEEPLERWYTKGNVFTIVEAGLSRNLSDQAKYILASQLSKAGSVIVSKIGEDGQHVQDAEWKQGQEEEKTKQEKIDSLLEYINACLKTFQCNRYIDQVYPWKLGGISDADFAKLSKSGYRSADMIKLPVMENNSFDSLFFFHVKTPIDTLEQTITSLFADAQAGNIIRLKGFIQDGQGKWMEVNATKHEMKICPISVGQELFIVIGEHLKQDVIGSYWESYCNEE